MGLPVHACIATLLLNVLLVSGAGRPTHGHIWALPVQQAGNEQRAEQQQVLPRKVMPTREPTTYLKEADIAVKKVYTAEQQQQQTYVQSSKSPVVGGSWTYTATSVEHQTVGCSLMSVIKRTMRQWVYAGEQLVGYRSYETQEMQPVDESNSIVGLADLEPVVWSHSSVSDSRYTADSSGTDGSTTTTTSTTTTHSAAGASSSGIDAAAAGTSDGSPTHVIVSGTTTGPAEEEMEIILFESRDGGATGGLVLLPRSQEELALRNQQKEAQDVHETLAMVDESYYDDSYFLALDEPALAAGVEEDEIGYDYDAIYSVDHSISMAAETARHEEHIDTQVPLTGLTQEQRVVVQTLLAALDQQEEQKLPAVAEEVKSEETRPLALKAEEEQVKAMAGLSEAEQQVDQPLEPAEMAVRNDDDERTLQGRKWFSLW